MILLLLLLPLAVFTNHEQRVAQVLQVETGWGFIMLLLTADARMYPNL